MRYGFYLPTRGPTATRAGVLALAREGERLGLHSAMIADHIVFPVESESAYPYTVDRKHPGGGDALERMIGPAVEKGTGAGNRLDHRFGSKRPTDTPAGIAPVLGQPVEQHHGVAIDVLDIARGALHRQSARHGGA